MNKALYKQYDSRWGSKPYPAGSTMSGCGCGCVACTHVVIEQDKYKNYTPENLRPWMVSQGFAIKGQGTTWSGITKTLQHYGYKKVVHIDIDDPMSKAWKELNKKNRIGVILFKGGRAPNGTVWTASGHYVAFTDYKVKNGLHYFYTKDSGGRCHDSATHGYYSYEKSMKGLVYQMWIVEKIKTSAPAAKTSTTTTATTTPSKLVVNGQFDSASVKALQKVLKVAQSGKITNQLSTLKKYHKGFSKSISYGKGSDATIKALQKKLKLTNLDGQLGPITITALQKFLKMKNSDGVFGTETAKALQKWINSQLNPSSAPKQTTAPKAKTPTKGEIIAQKALSYCGNSKKPTAAYKAAAKKVYGKGNDTNCHRFVGTVLKECGYPKMPIKGPTSTAWKNILKYLKKYFKELKVNFTEAQLQPGDIRVWRQGKKYHIWFITGKGKKAEAAHNKAYPHKAANNPKTKHTQDWLFRAK